jgi:hypothetical protein
MWPPAELVIKEAAFAAASHSLLERQLGAKLELTW